MEKENEKAKRFCMDRLDCSKYHLNSTEPHQIKIPCIEEADTKIKVEKSEDIQSTIDYEYEYETQDSTLADNLKSDDCDLITKIEIEEDFTDNLESDDCDLITKIEIEEDLVIKTESSDLSEFIEQCHKEDISEEIRTESEFIEPDEEIMNPVTIEEFFPQWKPDPFAQH